MGTVAELYRYPVKSMLGEALPVVEVTGRGLTGDRAAAVLDGAAGAVGSAKHPRKWGQLLRCRSWMEEPGAITVELPDGTALMRTVAREHRVPVLDLGRLSCVGVYLDVLEPGAVRVGDPVTRL